MEPVHVSTRAWCRAYAIPDPAQPLAPATQPIPELGAAWAEAYLPAPIAWACLILSSSPVSNLSFELQLAGEQGGWSTFPGLISPPFLGGPPFPGRAIRVLRAGGAPLPGELVSVMLAPVTWPAWAAPDPRELRGLAGFYR